MINHKMLKPVEKKYRITLLGGLHIGGSKEGLQIGGIDSPVVKNPLSGEPYIPGSSIKGKMRSMLEMINYNDQLNNEHELAKKRAIEKKQDPKKVIMNPIQDEKHIITKAFGGAGNIKISSRIIFGDFTLNQSFKIKFNELKSDFFEDKAENTVPRFLKGSANPRHIERVPAGVIFEGSIVLIPEEGEYGISEKELETILKDGIELLNKTYLGGGGSRGSGRISMELID